MFMNTVLSFPQSGLIGPMGALPDGAVREHVWKLLAARYPAGKFTERRVEQRFPYPQLIHLSPLASDGVTACGEPLVVVGKHLSERGLGFFHQHPLPHRRMLASLEMRHEVWVGLIIDITWCRFTHHGWYDSGGRFLRAVPSPLAHAS